MTAAEMKRVDTEGLKDNLEKVLLSNPLLMKFGWEVESCVIVTIPITDILQWGTVLLNFIPVKIKSI